jgi:hypothetical protein
VPALQSQSEEIISSRLSLPRRLARACGSITPHGALAQGGDAHKRTRSLSVVGLGEKSRSIALSTGAAAVRNAGEKTVASSTSDMTAREEDTMEGPELKIAGKPAGPRTNS